MLVEEVIEILEDKYPEELAYVDDYTGLQIGNVNKKVSGIIVSLDLNFGSIETAIHTGSNLIITHHPLLYSANLNKIDLTTVLGKKIEMLIKNDITVYSMHTNVDAAKDGLNDFLVDAIFDNYISEPLSPVDDEAGMGRIVHLSSPISRDTLIKLIKERLDTDHVRFIGKKDSYKNISFCSGSGSTFITQAKFFSEVYITGDVTYHTALQAMENGLDIIDVEHDATEKHFVTLIGDYLRNNGILAKISYYREPPLYKIY